MAKTCVTLRQKRRERLVKQHAERRAELKAIIADPNTDLDEKLEASRKLCKLPRDSSPVRLKNRCAITGRPHAFYRRFGVSRLVFRRLAHQGYLPGVRKASW